MDELQQLANIKREIFNEAETSIQKIVDQSIQWTKEYEEKMLAEVEKECMVRFRQYEKEIKNRAAQLIAQNQIECRNKRLVKENELSELIIDKARNELTKLRDNPDYIEIVKLLITEAVNKISEDDLEILIDSRDEKIITQDLLSSIEIIFTFSYNRVIKLNLSEKKIETTGGIIIKSKQKNLYINNTFEERFKLLENEIRREIAKTIFE